MFKYLVHSSFTDAVVTKTLPSSIALNDRNQTLSCANRENQRDQPESPQNPVVQSKPKPQNESPVKILNPDHSGISGDKKGFVFKQAFSSPLVPALMIVYL